jgi:glycerol-3-phosphate acyltransferase PlsX
MPDPVRIALDAMGGDRGPAIVVAGAALAHVRRPDTRYLFFGDRAVVDPILARNPSLKDAVTLVHTDVAVRMDDKPSQALRHGRRTSSMWLALEAVKTGEADVAVSAGNTGALMAMARFALRTMPGVDRPAIAAIWPTLAGESIVLDVGATVGADASQLVEFALMGGAMARVLFDVERPTVGLLNIGAEEIKGNEEVKEAGRRLRAADFREIDYRGFVEGDDLTRGVVDVIVTDGFTGNVALKTAEGAARFIREELKSALMGSLCGKLGALLATPALKKFQARLSPPPAAPLLGLNGVVLKCHGGASSVDFAEAVRVAVDLARSDFAVEIERNMRKLPAALAESSPPVADGAHE